MNDIQIQAVPNQDFFITLNEARYRLTITESAGIMSVTISRNEEIIIQNVRATAGTFLLPYLYEEDGNFLFFNMSGELINYQYFGTTQKLVYFSPDDLGYLRGTNG